MSPPPALGRFFPWLRGSNTWYSAAALAFSAAMTAQLILLGTRTIGYALLGGGPQIDAALIAAGLLGVAGGACLPALTRRQFMVLILLSAGSALLVVTLGTSLLSRSLALLPAFMRMALVALTLGFAACPLGAVLPSLVPRVGRARSLYASDLMGAALGVLLAAPAVTAFGVGFTVAAALATLLLLVAFFFPTSLQQPVPTPAPGREKFSFLPQSLKVAALLAGFTAMVEVALPMWFAPVTAKMPFVLVAVIFGALLGGSVGATAVRANAALKDQGTRAIFGGAIASAAMLVLMVPARPLILEVLSTIDWPAPTRMLLAGSVIALIASLPSFASGRAAALALGDSTSPRPVIALTSAAAALGALLAGSIFDFVSPPGLLCSLTSALFLALLLTRNAWQKRALAGIAMSLGIGVVISPAGPDYGSTDLSRTLLLAQRTPAARAPEQPPIRTTDRWDQTGRIVVEIDNDETLYRDGKPDASALGDLDTQTLLAVLPLATHPTAQRALVIGLGSGRTAQVLAQAGMVVTAVEFSKVVAETYTPRLPERVTVVREEARAFLAQVPQNSEALFDIITAEPTNLFIAGQPRLVSVEGLRLMEQALTDQGVLVLWSHSYLASEESFSMLVRTVGAVFDRVALYKTPTSDVLLLASNHEQDLKVPELAQRLGPGRACVLAALDHVDGSGLGARYIALGPGQGPIETDAHPRLAVLASEALLNRRQVRLHVEPLPQISAAEHFLHVVRTENKAFSVAVALRRRLAHGPMSAFEVFALLRSSAGRHALADHASVLALQDPDTGPAWAPPLLEAALAAGAGRANVEALIKGLSLLGDGQCANAVAWNSALTVTRLTAKAAPDAVFEIVRTLQALKTPARRALRRELSQTLCQSSLCCQEAPALALAAGLDCSAAQSH